MRIDQLSIKVFIVLLNTVVATGQLVCQVTIGGSTVALANNCYRLTPAINAQSGYAYDQNSINLNDSFDFTFSVNLGNNQAGADGMMFILRPDLNSATLIAGQTGGSIGYTGPGLENGSMGIEIDTYENGDYADPSFDHISIFKNASANHNLPNALTLPVQASATSVNIEDGNNHTFQVEWNPITEKISIYFDCQLRLEYTGNLIDSIFGGNPNVFYGMIATTGGVNNTHSFCFTQSIDSLVSELLNDTVCAGEPISLLAGFSPAAFSWSPSNGLNQSNIPDPISTPSSNTTYTVTASYLCETREDTVIISVFETDAGVFSLGNDTVICAPDSIAFDLSQAGYASFLWHDGSQADKYSTSISEVIRVEITDTNQCSFSDTISIDISNAPILNLGGDVTSCNGDSVRLAPAFPALSYKWSTGETSSSIYVFESGVYWLSLSLDSICFSSDTIALKTVVSPPLFIGNDTTICPNESLKLSASSSKADIYRWSNGSQDSLVIVSNSGFYWVEIRFDDCKFSDSILVGNKKLVELDLGRDTSICRGDSFFLSTSVPNALTYSWSDGVIDSVRYFANPGIYELNVLLDNGCETFGNLRISEITCATTLLMPNILTPNEDGINDLFEFYQISGIESADVQIFNRWGIPVHRNLLGERSWDGTSNGISCSEGVYFWIVEFTDIYGKSGSEKGSLSLIR